MLNILNQHNTQKQVRSTRKVEPSNCNLEGLHRPLPPSLQEVARKPQNNQNS